MPWLVENKEREMLTLWRKLFTEEHDSELRRKWSNANDICSRCNIPTKANKLFTGYILPYYYASGALLCKDCFTYCESQQEHYLDQTGDFYMIAGMQLAIKALTALHKWIISLDAEEQLTLHKTAILEIMKELKADNKIVLINNKPSNRNIVN